MPNGLSLGLNLVSLVVFLLPGLAGVKLGLLIADRADWLNRVDTVALSFGVSLVSMGVVYTWFSALALRPMTTTALSPIWNDILVGIVMYLDILGVSLFVGMLLGVFDFGGDSVARRKGLWYKFFSEIESELEDEEYQVRVRMQSGDELWGRVEDKGEISVNRDVLLENPRRIVRSEDGSIGDTYRYTGKAYLHNQDISHIELDELKTADETGNVYDWLLRDADSRVAGEYDRETANAESDAEMDELETLAKEADENATKDET